MNDRAPRKRWSGGLLMVGLSLTWVAWTGPSALDATQRGSAHGAPVEGQITKAGTGQGDEGTRPKPLFDLHRYLKADSAQRKELVKKEFGAAAVYTYEKAEGSFLWRVRLDVGTLRIIPGKESVVSVMVDFDPPLQDRGDALALLGLDPLAEPSADGEAGVKWIKVFQGIDEVVGGYAKGGKKLVSLVIYPDKKAAGETARSH